MNLVGEVTVYQTSRHAAFDDAGSPTQLYAIKPQVVVVNNGPRKGLGGTSPGFDEVMTRHYQRIAGSPGLEGVWQGHRSLFAPGSEDNTAEEMIANRGGPRFSDRLLRWSPDPTGGIWNATKETELPG